MPLTVCQTGVISSCILSLFLVTFLVFAGCTLTWVAFGTISIFGGGPNPPAQLDTVVVPLDAWFYCSRLPNLPYEVYQLVIQTFIDSDIISTLDVRGCRNQKRLALPKVTTSVALSSKAIYRLMRAEWAAACIVPAVFVAGWVKGLARAAYFERIISFPVNLSRSRSLEVASFNLRQTFEYRDGAWHLPPLVENLPSRLKKIEFWRLHASEFEVIDLANRLCPQVVEFRLVYCTMFNDPECVWWSGHQADNDHHYMKGYDLPTVLNYAVRFSISIVKYYTARGS
ncbi:hypothetical protein FRC08_003273 [Ceratobasidium sp. 394]|nr:hypothetical protein FRC08_003273 [Ceratobasidium sp. 394]